MKHTVPFLHTLGASLLSARVGQHNIDPIPLLHGSLHSTLADFRVCYVARYRQYIGPEGLFLDGGLALFEVPEATRNEDYLSASFGVEVGGGSANALGATGNDDDLILVGLRGKVRLRVDQRVHAGI